MNLYEQTVTLRIRHMASAERSAPEAWSWQFLLDLTDPESVEVVSATENKLVKAVPFRPHRLNR